MACPTGPLTAHRTEALDVWAGRAEPLLDAAPDAHHVIATILAGLRADPSPLAAPGAVLAWVQDGDESVAAALRVPPHPFVITTLPAAAAPPLAGVLGAAGAADPLIAGPAEAAGAVAAAWARATGLRAERVMAQTIHTLAGLDPQPAPPPGAPRDAAPRDRGRLESWMAAFAAEIGLPAEDPVAYVARALSDGRLALWDDDGPACLVRWSPAALGRVRITAVYTPPERRGRGYARATVAGVTERLVAGGTGVIIVTDAGDPTPNRVYARVGFRPAVAAAIWAVRRP